MADDSTVTTTDDQGGTQTITPNTGQQTQAGGMPNTQQQAGSSTPDNTELAAELERTRQALKQANSEAAERRKKLEAFEKAEQERKDAELSEVDRLTKRNAELEQAAEMATKQARETTIRSAFVAAAAQANATNPADAYALAMADGATVEVVDGKVSGVDEAVKALVDAGRLPVRRAVAPSLDGGAGSGQRPAEIKANNLTQDELDIASRMRLTPEQYMKAKGKQ